MMKFQLPIAIAAALLISAGAASAFQKKQPVEEAKPLPPMTKNFPLDQTFSLRELNGKPISADLDVSLKVDGALRGSGFGGCNSWSGTVWPAKEQHLMSGSFTLTKKKCDKDTMDIENGFLNGLLGTPKWDLVNGDLVIEGPRGKMRLVRSL